MPVVELPLTSASKQKLYHHDPNSSLNTQDVMRLSGSVFQDSLLQVMTTMVRATYGNFDSAIVPIGFKISSYTPTEIQVGPGILIAPDGMYRFEGAVLSPDPASFWGIYELEMVTELEDPVGKKFIEPSTSATFLGSGPSRKSFRIRLYENYSTTASFPILTPGRVELIKYKKGIAGPLGNIVQSSNSVSKNAPKNAFSPGFIRQSLSPGDGIEWLTVGGQDVPVQFTDLIDFLRDECRINDSALDFTLDDNGGSTRVNFASPINIKNLFASPDLRYSCVKITESSAPNGLPLGMFKVMALTVNNLTLDIPYTGAMAGQSGKLFLTPFGKSDLDGGGARLPFPSYLRNFIAGNPLDVNRLPLTYQAGQNKAHVHTSANLSVSGQGTFPVGVSASTGDDSPDHSHPQTRGGGSGNAQPGGGQPAFDSTNVGANQPIGNTLGASNRHQHGASGSGSLSLTGLDVAGTTDISGGDDPDNPNVTRVDDMAVYLLIKT